MHDTDENIWIGELMSNDERNATPVYVNYARTDHADCLCSKAKLNDTVFELDDDAFAIWRIYTKEESIRNIP